MKQILQTEQANFSVGACLKNISSQLQYTLETTADPRPFLYLSCDLTNKPVLCRD
jgi:hypothetical protein